MLLEVRKIGHLDQMTSLDVDKIASLLFLAVEDGHRGIWPGIEYLVDGDARTLLQQQPSSSYQELADV